MLTEFYVDLYENNPTEIHRTEDGDYRLEDTGDPYFDKWEEERASGIDPDLTEMFSSEEMAWYHRKRNNTDQARQNLHLQEAASAHQAALARKLTPSRFNTFGDD